jgi:hypothetical protein
MIAVEPALKSGHASAVSFRHGVEYRCVARKQKRPPGEGGRCVARRSISSFWNVPALALAQTLQASTVLQNGASTALFYA